MTGHKHATDREDVTIVAECPNIEQDDGPHLSIEAEFGPAEDATAVKQELVEALPECGECGSDLDAIAYGDQSKVLTDGGRRYSQTGGGEP
jgi:hypothetical protein